MSKWHHFSALKIKNPATVVNANLVQITQPTKVVLWLIFTDHKLEIQRRELLTEGPS